jgi:GAF domain-containing protein
MERSRTEIYRDVRRRLEAVLADETDWIAAMATVVCELHNAFAHFHWTGFYRVLGKDDPLVIGPYQGTQGCLRIDLGRGVCGAAAREKRTQLVEDVRTFPGHIACDARTKSEIVVPILTPAGDVLAVLDVDSREPAAFVEEDRRALEDLCRELGRRYGASRED